MTLSDLFQVMDGSMPSIALVVFVVLFVSIIIYVLLIPKSLWQRDAELPLERPRNVGEETEHQHVER